MTACCNADSTPPGETDTPHEIFADQLISFGIDQPFLTIFSDKGKAGLDSILEFCTVQTYKLIVATDVVETSQTTRFATRLLQFQAVFTQSLNQYNYSRILQ